MSSALFSQNQESIYSEPAFNNKVGVDFSLEKVTYTDLVCLPSTASSEYEDFTIDDTDDMDL